MNIVDWDIDAFLFLLNPFAYPFPKDGKYFRMRRHG